MSGTDKSVGIKPDDHRYDDMLRLPHHVSATRPHMPIRDRAAQFAPFAALSGHGAAIRETARLTDRRMELDEDCKAALSERLQIVLEHLPQRPEITVTFFQPDTKKAGGAYVEVSGSVKKIDDFERIIVMADGTTIPINEIIGLEGELFRFLEDTAE